MTAPSHVFSLSLITSEIGEYSRSRIEKKGKMKHVEEDKKEDNSVETPPPTRKSPRSTTLKIPQTEQKSHFVSRQILDEYVSQVISFILQTLYVMVSSLTRYRSRSRARMASNAAAGVC